MASITPRKNKSGDIISYQVKVSRGRDPLTGKQLKPFTTTYTLPIGWSNKAIERDLMRFVGEFEAACKRGEVKTKEETRAEAQAAQEAAEAARLEELLKPTFSKFMERYLEDISVDRGILTVQNYRKILERAAKVFGDMKMESITHLDLRDYITNMQFNAISSKGKPFSIQTCRWHYTGLHTFFQRAVEDDIIALNPMNRVKMPKQSKDTTVTKEEKAYSQEQVNELLEHAAKAPLKMYCLIRLALDSWMRRGELCGLRWSDIDMVTGLVKIERAIQYDSKKGIFITSPKSGKRREIYISQPTLKLLARWKKEQSAFFLKHGWKSEYVFTKDVEPEPFNPNTLSDRVKRFGKRNGFPGLHPHQFRHTGISLALLNGEDITSVSKRAGHASVDITLNIYSHTTQAAQKHIAETLGSVIGKV